MRSIFNSTIDCGNLRLRTAIACRKLTLRTNSFSVALCFERFVEFNYSIHKSEPKQIEMSTYLTRHLFAPKTKIVRAMSTSIGSAFSHRFLNIFSALEFQYFSIGFPLDRQIGST